MKSLALCFFLVFAVYGSELNLKSSTKGRSTEVNVTESQRENIETVAINVRRVHVDRDQNGDFEDATMLKVNIQVSVIDGIVHVNKSKAIHASVTAFHFFAEIDEIGKNEEVLQRLTKVPIVIRVLVTEATKHGSNGQVGKMLIVEEEITEVNNKVVEQIDVKQVVITLDSANNELLAKREMTVIALKDSEIHKKPASDDTHKYPDGRLPHPKLKQPKLPEEPYKVDKSKHGICAAFYKLPFAARIAIVAVIALFGLGTFGCCLYMFCCKPPAQGKKLDLKDFEDKFYYDVDLEAPPLENKVPIEKQQLVIDA